MPVPQVKVKSNFRESTSGSVAIKSGMLTKKGSSGLKRKQLRYFELAGHFLRYAETESHMKRGELKGAIDLHKATRMETEGSQMTKTITIGIREAGQVAPTPLELEADNQASASAWRDQIEGVIDAKRELQRKDSKDQLTAIAGYKGPAAQATVQAVPACEACDDYQVDKAAAQFKICKCGRPENEHDNVERLPGGNSKRGGRGPRRKSKSLGSIADRPACGAFDLDIKGAGGFNVCKCGRTKDAHAANVAAGAKPRSASVASNQVPRSANLMPHLTGLVLFVEQSPAQNSLQKAHKKMGLGEEVVHQNKDERQKKQKHNADNGWMINRKDYSLEELQDKTKVPKGVADQADYIANKETYLHDGKFEELFRMDKVAFAKQPFWKKKGLKEKHGLH